MYALLYLMILLLMKSSASARGQCCPVSLLILSVSFFAPVDHRKVKNTISSQKQKTKKIFI